MNQIDLKIKELQLQIKKLRKCKKDLKKVERYERLGYRPPLFNVIGDWIDSVCLCFENIVKKL